MTKFLHVYAEELSMKYLLDALLPKVLPEDIKFRVYPHQGKQDLENGLRKTVKTYSKEEGNLLMVTQDKDSADCKKVMVYSKPCVIK